VLRRNYSAFEVLTPEAKYWCGFIAGDGCVISRGSIQLNISWKDHLHLDEFAKFMHSRKKPKEVFIKDDRIWGDGHMARLSICGRDSTDKLISLGIVPRKCKVDFVVCKELSCSRDFWRGMIDSDGSVYIGKNQGQLFPVLAMSQSGKNIMLQFSDYVRAISGYIFEPKPHSVWKVAMNGNKARDIINHLYYDGCLGLERKVVTAEKCKKWKGIRELNREQRNLAWRTRIKPGDTYKYALKIFQDPLLQLF
jgi:hypothetical protein